MTPSRPSAAGEEPGPSRLPGAAVGSPCIEIESDIGLACTPDLAWLRRHLTLAAATIDRPIQRLAVRLVDDATMRRLHLQYHGIDETTDVLTFALSDAGEPIDSDIAVCVDEASRRSIELGHRLEHELLLYCVHGLLHCAGHDDHDAADAATMHAREDHILESIGVGRTFEPRRAGGG